MPVHIKDDVCIMDLNKRSTDVDVLIDDSGRNDSRTIKNVPSNFTQVWDKSTEWPQIDIDNYEIKGTPYLLLLSPLTRHFRACAPKDPIMILTTTRSKVPHMYY